MQRFLKIITILLCSQIVSLKGYTQTIECESDEVWGIAFGVLYKFQFGQAGATSVDTVVSAATLGIGYNIFDGVDSNVLVSVLDEELIYFADGDWINTGFFVGPGTVRGLGAYKHSLYVLRDNALQFVSSSGTADTILSGFNTAVDDVVVDCEGNAWIFTATIVPQADTLRCIDSTGQVIAKYPLEIPIFLVNASSLILRNDTFYVGEPNIDAMMPFWLDSGIVIRGLQEFTLPGPSFGDLASCHSSSPLGGICSTGTGSNFSVSFEILDTVSCPNNPCAATVNANAAGGVPPYTYLWSDAETAASNDSLCSGLITVTVTDGSGSTVSETVNVNVISNCQAATSVNISSVAANSSQVNWTGNECAVKYRVRVKNMSTGTVNLYFVSAPDTDKALTSLTANTTYQVKVRSQCSTNGSILSPWSNAVTFTTQGATDCIYPTNLTAAPTSNSTATVSWTPVTNAAGYQIRYKQNGATAWNPIVVNNGSASSYDLTSLSPNTVYEYQVRTKCSVNPNTFSNYSPIQQFTTLLRLGENELPINVQLYPNPSNGDVTFNSNGLVGTLEIFDAVGKLILHQPVSNSQTTLTKLPNGFLTYRFVAANGTSFNGKIVVAK